jgi:hypothetical protein
MVNLAVDGSLKGSPQSGIVDSRDVLFENSRAPRIIERGDHLADFAARPAKETRCRWTPLQPARRHVSSASPKGTGQVTGKRVYFKG